MSWHIDGLRLWNHRLELVQARNPNAIRSGFGSPRVVSTGIDRLSLGFPQIAVLSRLGLGYLPMPLTGLPLIAMKLR